MTPITAEEAVTIERAIAAVEGRTGVQLVAAIVPRSDAYPELAWRAFALGASLAALIAVVIDAGRPDWLSAQRLLVQALVILGSAAVMGLAAARIPGFGILFLRRTRAAAEVRQCAEVLFLSRELFATPGRNALLVQVSEFERRVVIVPDVAYRGRVGTAEWEAVVAVMTPRLHEGRAADAFIAGIAAIEALLLDKGFAGAAKSNLLPDGLVRGGAR